jgi:trehalose utilization protein
MKFGAPEITSAVVFAVALALLVVLLWMRWKKKDMMSSGVVGKVMKYEKFVFGGLGALVLGSGGYLGYCLFKDMGKKKPVVVVSEPL